MKIFECITEINSFHWLSCSIFSKFYLFIPFILFCLFIKYNQIVKKIYNNEFSFQLHRFILYSNLFIVNITLYLIYYYRIIAIFLPTINLSNSNNPGQIYQHQQPGKNTSQNSCLSHVKSNRPHSNSVLKQLNSQKEKTIINCLLKLNIHNIKIDLMPKSLYDYSDHIFIRKSH